MPFPEKIPILFIGIFCNFVSWDYLCIQLNAFLRMLCADVAFAIVRSKNCINPSGAGFSAFNRVGLHLLG